MDTKFIQDFNRHFSVVQCWNNDGGIGINSPELYSAIRAVTASFQVGRKTQVNFEVQHSDLVGIFKKLLYDNKLPTELAILAAKTVCIGQVYIFKETTVEELFQQVIKIPQRFQQICYLFGIIDCLPTAVNQHELIIVFGETIIQLLKDYNPMYYYQLKLLHTWLLHVKSVSSSIPKKDSLMNKMFLPNGEILKILQLHWETPYAGCPELCADCVSTICEIWQIVHSSCHYADILAKSTLTDLLWKSKTKYLILATLVPFIRFSEVLCEYPDSVYAMTGSLNSNYLLPAGTFLFKSLTKHIEADVWSDFCQGVLLDALNHPNKVIKKNAIQYWLPCISHASHQVYKELTSNFNEASQNFNWLAYISLLKLSPVELEDRDRTIVLRALKHGEDEVRISAFGILCYSKKKSDPVQQQTWDLVCDFIFENLHSDDPQFRQKLLSNLKVLLVRVMENSMTYIKPKQIVSESSIQVQLEQNINNVQQLHANLIRNLFNGASYQRKVATLGALLLIHQLFGDSDSLAAASLAKGANINKRHLLIQLATARSKWNWTDQQSLERYSICLMDEVQEVRERAGSILRDYFRPPSDFVSLLYEHGTRLSDSPKFQRSECGSSVLQLVAHWSLSGVGVPQFTTLRSAVSFLVNAIEVRFEKLKLDWLATASQSPVHGFIGALTKVLQLKSQEQLESYQHLIKLCQNVSDFMLEALSKKSNSNPDTAPSFEEMSESIKYIISQDPDVQAGDNVSISVQHQLILACAWLNLKESALLAVQISCYLMNNRELSETERACQVEECGNVIVKILIRCRHKGAIEANGDALGALCRKLYTSQEEQIRCIPGNLLRSFLTRLEQSQTGASITRRSAGLAFLVGKIVSTEPKKTEDSLIALATERLIKVASREVDENDDGSCDLPQAIAMHILQSLIHDASLSLSIQPWIESIIRLSINSFTHPHWSIRNAALQLYGAVVPRLVGNTKNRESPCGSPTTAELFHKFPHLQELLLSTLVDTKEEDQVLLSGGLIPSLSLLSRVSPSSDPQVNAKFVNQLSKLLGHSVIQVRVLASQGLLAFIPLFKTKQTVIHLCDDAQTLAYQEQGSLNICQLGDGTTNTLHGCLLAVYEFLNRCKDIALSFEDWEIIKKSIKGLYQLEKEHPSFYVKLSILKLFQIIGIGGDYDFFFALTEQPGNHNSPGFGEWIRLKTELVLEHFSLTCVLPAIKAVLHCSHHGRDVVESALKVLTHRVVRLSASSVVANSVISYVFYYIQHADTFPTLLPMCLEFVLLRGATCLIGEESSLKSCVDIFLNECIQQRKFGSTTAVMAVSTVAAVIRESVEKSLMEKEDLQDSVSALMRILYDTSQPTQTLQIRAASAQSLKSTGQVWLEMANKDGETSRNLFLAIFNLIQDEEKDVRMDVAVLLSGILAVGDSDPLDLMSSNHCMKGFAFHIQRWFHPVHLVPVVLDWLCQGRIGSQEESQQLYESEDPNFYSEEGESIDFLIAVAESCLRQLPPSGQQIPIEVDQLLEDADRLIRQVEVEDKERRMFTRSSEIQSALRRMLARIRIVSCVCYKGNPAIEHLNRIQIRMSHLSVA